MSWASNNPSLSILPTSNGYNTNNNAPQSPSLTISTILSDADDSDQDSDVETISKNDNDK